ncbi:phosphonate C-P lyase system protein PhnH [Veronia pacifica]|uniref:Phosphonate C-P lyase system protein PhnH n=1 Tax=Veronia pacifica TaxID=1080227 RepID=A0A1C3EIH7_9GAMM|nr:phosphonate C-P lyase system protein PhnH [Veronia pacifica]ODA33028.1 phosphonate C-P lyase system protein PhnH [Veronia pacifica]
MSTILDAFDTPIHDSQQCFRLVLDALSRPGTVKHLPFPPAFGALSSAATQILLTLADQATRIYLPQQHASNDIIVQNLKFHAGCSVTTQRNEADFGVVSGSADETFEGFMFGDESYPDRSTTLLIEVSDFTSGRVFNMEGPGIKTRNEVVIGGLSESVASALVNQRGNFPLGLDLILTAGSQAMAIPRSVKLSQSSEGVCTSQ